MRVAFVGGDHLPPAQEAALKAVLADLGPVTEFHHPARSWGDELGIHAVKLLYPACRIVAHPEEHPALRSQGAVLNSDEKRPECHHLVRLCHVLAAGEVLVACPDGPETRTSRVWYTIRTARPLGRPIHILDPAGVHLQEIPRGRRDRNRLDGFDLEPVAGLPEGQPGVRALLRGDGVEAQPQGPGRLGPAGDR